MSKVKLDDISLSDSNNIQESEYDTEFNSYISQDDINQKFDYKKYDLSRSRTNDDNDENELISDEDDTDDEIDDNEDDISADDRDIYEEDCIYNYAEESDEDDNDFEEYIDSDNDQILDDDNIVPPEERITKPYLYDFERVRLIGSRTKGLSLGAKPMIKNVDHLTPKKIATLEINKKIIPLKIKRPLPNGKKEIWGIKELILNF